MLATVLLILLPFLNHLWNIEIRYFWLPVLVPAG
jgi:hypothetical protein